MYRDMLLHLGHHEELEIEEEEEVATDPGVLVMNKMRMEIKTLTADWEHECSHARWPFETMQPKLQISMSSQLMLPN